MAIYDWVKRIRSLFKFGEPVKPPPGTIDGRDFEEGSEDEWIYNGHWLFCASRDVSEIAYRIDLKELYIKFINHHRLPGRSNVIVYYNVPEDVARAFYRTDSKGRFVWNVFRAEGYNFAYLTSLHDPSTEGPQVIRRI